VAGHSWPDRRPIAGRPERVACMASARSEISRDVVESSKQARPDIAPDVKQRGNRGQGVSPLPSIEIPATT
jgi:hypothetical protein